MPQALVQQTVSTPAAPRSRRWPPELSILMVLVGLALGFELLGWIFERQSFLLNEHHEDTQLRRPAPRSRRCGSAYGLLGQSLRHCAFRSTIVRQVP